MNITYRIPNKSHWPEAMVNQVHEGDSRKLMQQIPDACIALIVTSPPYWNMIDYGSELQIGQSDYETYLNDLLPVWKEAERVLIPNGKLAIITPIMPIPKKQIGNQHTRHLKNISSDIEHSILSHIKGLHRFSLFVWQKQTSVKMFGSYPYPPNLYEDNTIEFINVLVKDGAPPPIPANAKDESKITQAEWRNLTMQTWPIYPADVRRSGGHPCPFPIVIPQRLVKMYTFQKSMDDSFAGDIVLDMFNGTGATCLAAKSMKRNYIGFDANPAFCATAIDRLAHEEINADKLFLQPVTVKNPTLDPTTL